MDLKLTIELILSPVKKSSLKSFIYNLFVEFDIDDETDVRRIEYLNTQNQMRNDLYDECRINFNNEIVAVLFLVKCQKFIENDGNSVILSVKALDEDIECIDSDEDGAISVCSTSVSMTQSIKNGYVNIKPGHKSISLTRDANDTNSFPHSLNSAIKTICDFTNKTESLAMSNPVRASSKLSQNNDNSVEIQITPRIQEKDHDNDLELILLFLQNKRRSDGGEIEHHKLNDAMSKLTVHYKDQDTKQRILAKHSFSIKDYTLTASEPLTESVYNRNKNVLILRNIAHGTDDMFLILYAENIVPNNEISEIYTSKVYNETYYVRFQKEFEFNEVVQGYQRRPTLCGRKIDILEAYDTQSIVCVLNTRKDILYDLVDLHFTNKKRSGVDSYLWIKEQKPFVLINFESDEQVTAVLNKKHDLCKEELIVERHYNVNLIEDALNKTNANQVKIVESPPKAPVHSINENDVKVSKILVKEEVAKKEIINENPVTQQAKQINKPETYKFLLDKKINTILFVLLYNCGKVLSSFKDYLRKQNYDISINEADAFYIKYTLTEEANRIDELIEEFIRTQNYSFEIINVPSSANVQLHEMCKEMNLKLTDSFLTAENKDFIEFYGNANSFETLKNELNQLFQNSQIKKTKEDISIFLDSDNMQIVNILKYFDELYLKEFKEILGQFNLNCKIDNRYGLRAQIIQDDTDIHVHIDDALKKQIELCIEEFFDRFKVVQYHLKHDQTIETANCEKEFLVHIEESNEQKTIEVYGLRDKVDAFIESLDALTGFSKVEARILHACKYTSDMQEKYPEMTVKVDTKRCKIFYESPNDKDIQFAKQYAQNLFSKVQHEKFQCDPILKEFMRINERSLITWIKVNSFLCVFDLDSNEVGERDDYYFIYGIGQNEIKRCFEALSDSIMIKKYKLDENFSRKVDTFIDQLTARAKWNSDNKQAGYIAKKVTQNFFCICGFRDKTEDIDKEFTEFIGN